MNIIQDKLIKRSSKNYIQSILSKNTNWKVLDIGCGYTANKFATTICDVQDLSHFYKDKNFVKLDSKKLPFEDNHFDFVIASHVLEHVDDYKFFIKELERISSKGYIELPTKLEGEILPFKDNEFDFVIASHVLEHVKDVNIFIKELERVSSKGYIELPTILEDNLVFENKKDHLWHMEFDDVNQKLNISKKIQYLEPFLTVSSSKKFSKIFRQSLILELYWENKIDFDIKFKAEDTFQKISRLSLFRKFLSKNLRNIFRRN